MQLICRARIGRFKNYSLVSESGLCSDERGVDESTRSTTQIIRALALYTLVSEHRLCLRKRGVGPLAASTTQ